MAKKTTKKPAKKEEVKKTKVSKKPATKVEEGSIVRVHYTGTLDSGEKFDSSEGKDPIEFTVGQHNVIKGFEDAVLAMKPGDKKKVTIKSSDAYGDVNPQLKQKVPKEAMGEVKPEVGMVLAIQHPQMPQPMPAKVLKVGDKEVTLDLNHPLAGQTLHFALELVEIK